jgi:hypothetical protein
LALIFQMSGWSYIADDRETQTNFNFGYEPTWINENSCDASTQTEVECAHPNLRRLHFKGAYYKCLTCKAVVNQKLPRKNKKRNGY